MRDLILTISFILACTIAIAQLADESSQPNLSDYEKIYLNDQLAYLNKHSRKVISKFQFDSIQAAVLGEAFVIKTEFDHWDTTKFHIYNTRPTTPFRLVFPDTEFHPPVEGDQIITSRFGKRRRGPHRGIDIDLKVGDPVMSVLPGVVRFVNYSRGHGKTVVIRHDNNIETVYAHLSEYNVKVNERVPKGYVIGKGGQTGNARGSHLHFEVRYRGEAIHPEYIFNFKEFTLNEPSLWVTSKWTNPLNHTSTRKSHIDCITSLDQIKAKKPSAAQLVSDVHVIQKGDTLYSLARRYNSTVERLCSMNGIDDPTQLKIGQNIKLK